MLGALSCFWNPDRPRDGSVPFPPTGTSNGTLLGRDWAGARVPDRETSIGRNSRSPVDDE
jgi:hypothetical protein